MPSRPDTKGKTVSLAILLAAILLVAAPHPVAAQERAPAPVAHTDNLEAAGGGGAGSKSRVANGDRAPDFQYQSYDKLWQNLHNMLEHGDVLLVFGASDVDLRTLERERELLLAGGVTPLAVLERSERDVWASVRRLGLTYSLLADPRGAIGAQYGVFDPGIGRSQTSWFVIDRKGRVRQRGEDMPKQSWPAVAAQALDRKESGTKAASKTPSKTASRSASKSAPSSGSTR